MIGSAIHGRKLLPLLDGTEGGLDGCGLVVDGLSAVPHALQAVDARSFFVPHWGQSLVATAVRTWPACLRLPSTRSPPHWVQTLLLPGLRVPQNGQWISEPLAASSIFFWSVIFWACSSSAKEISSGCGAPHCLQVFSKPLFFAWQLGHSQFNSTYPKDLFAIL